MFAIGMSFCSVLLGAFAFVWSAHYELCRETGHDWIFCLIVAGAL